MSIRKVIEDIEGNIRKGGSNYGSGTFEEDMRDITISIPAKYKSVSVYGTDIPIEKFIKALFAGAIADDSLIEWLESEGENLRQLGHI